MSKVRSFIEFEGKFRFIVFGGILANGVLSAVLIGPIYDHPFACIVFLLASNILWQTICSFWEDYLVEKKKYEARFRRLTDKSAF